MQAQTQTPVLFVDQGGDGSIVQYNATTGAVINANLGKLSNANAYTFAISGDILFEPNGLYAVGKYNAITGAVINASFITGVYPTALAVSGNSLFVWSEATGVVGKYDATTGVPINPNFISGWYGSDPHLTVSGNILFLSSDSVSAVVAYDTTTGTELYYINVPNAEGMVVSGNNLFALSIDGNGTTGRVMEFNAATGAAINANFITGLYNPLGIAVYNNSLFVANYGTGTIGEYDATNGAAINANFLTGILNAGELAVVPESMPVPTPVTPPVPRPVCVVPPPPSTLSPYESLNQAWFALSWRQQHRLKHLERVWVRWVNKLPVDQRAAAIEARAAYLRSLVAI